MENTIHKSWRSESCRDYGEWRNPQNADAGICREQVQTGAILRIADAIEKMAGSYSGLIADRDYYQKRMKQSEGENLSFRRTIAGLKGYIKRMKK